MYKVRSFNDSHMHLLGIGLNNIEYIDLSKVKSIKDLIELLNGISNKEYIIARGWNQNQFEEKRVPTKEDLKEVTIDVPIVLIRSCGHILVCNEKMMDISNITKDTKQVEGGTFDISYGIFSENSLELIYSCIPKPNKTDIKSYLTSANKELLSNGITSIGSDDFSTLNVDYELVIKCYKELYEEDKIQIRVLEQVNLPSIELLQDFIDKGYVNKKYKGFKMGPLKLLADGSLGARTAYLNKPYSDDLENIGIKVFDQEKLDELVYLADSNNMDVAIHAIGDGTIDMVIDAIWKSMNRTNRTHHRHSIIHSQLATKKQIKRMKELNIAAQVQPIFLNSDMSIVEDRLGKKRSKESYLFNTMYKEGVHVSFGTDCPVETLNPFRNLYSAITRTSIKNPELGVFLENEKFTLDDALKCYTENPYYLSYDEHNYKEFNDYIIVDRDIHKCTIEELKDTVVLETYIDGKLEYKRK